jgi:hypothetical protein
VGRLAHPPLIQTLHPLISHVGLPGLEPIEATALDPYDMPDNVVDRLAWLCGQPEQVSTAAFLTTGECRNVVETPRPPS